MPPVTVGQRVTIVLPTLVRTPGIVTAVRSAGPPAGGTRAHGSGASAGVLTVLPAHPRATGTGSGIAVQIALTIQSVRNVLAVPVAALLALAGGGYGVEIVAPSGGHRLVGVRAGIFAGGLVQVSGSGLAPGTKVVVAQ